MTFRELDRVRIIKSVIAGSITQVYASKMLKLSASQVSRLKNKYEQEGPTGLWKFSVLSYQYQTFQNRLQEGLVKPLNPELIKLLNRDDYLTLLEFISQVVLLGDLDPMSPFRSLLELKPGDCIRFNKAMYSLPRTLSLIRDYSGEFKLFVETKSKTSTGVKQDLPLLEGSCKRGKPAWRIDGLCEEYMNLVACERDDAPGRKILDIIKQEVKMQNKYISPFIASLDLGPSYYGKNKFKVSMYSPKALGSLETIVNTNNAFLTEPLKKQFVLEMLIAVDSLHKDGIIHQDLKTDNILIYQNGDVEYCLKVTDFGFALNEENKWIGTLAGTPLFFSPEVLFAHHQIRSDLWIFLMHVKGGGALAFELLQSKIDGDSNFSNRSSYLNPHKANDMWVVGLNLYFILYGELPSLANWDTIQRCPLLKGLLTFSREDRLTSEQALKVHYLIQSKDSLLTEMTDTHFLDAYNYVAIYLPHLHEVYIDSLSANELSALLLLMKQQKHAIASIDIEKNYLKGEGGFNQEFNVNISKNSQFLPSYELCREQKDKLKYLNASNYYSSSDSEEYTDEETTGEEILGHYYCNIF